jgi:peptidoglycan hydrolase-like protein with peptidoglycan-binding domain
VVRFLILLEIVLVGLLAVRWFDADTEPHAGNIVAERALSGPPRSAGSPLLPPYLPLEDRTRLTRDLLGSTAADAPSVTVAGRAEPDPQEAPGQALPAPERKRVVEAQRLLSRLGYSLGPADGVLGERTEHALDAWQRRSGRPGGAELNAALLAQLRKDARAMQAMANARTARSATQRNNGLPDVGNNDGRTEPAWVATLAGGFQRLFGRKFDSRRNPLGIREYCSVNRETWIFDEGRGTFLWCEAYPTRS